MAATVYSTPEHLPLPDLADYVGGGIHDIDGWFEARRQHQNDVAIWCRENSDSTSELVGEVITFQVADGKAIYMVYRTKPLELIELDDEYRADPILLRGLRVSDVREIVARERKLAELFGRRK